MRFPRRPANQLVCEHQRLRIDLVVDSDGMEQAEGRALDVRCRKHRFVLIPPRLLDIIVVRDDVGSGRQLARVPKGCHLHHPSSGSAECCRCVVASRRRHKPVFCNVAIRCGDDATGEAGSRRRELTGRRAGSKNQLLGCGRRDRLAVRRRARS